MIFASEIILANFAIGSLTPIVIAAVLADVVQAQCRSQGFEPAFPELQYLYLGDWAQLPSYLMLGLLCGLAAVGFTKLLYFVEDVSLRWLPLWWLRALVLGVLVGVAGVAYTAIPPVVSPAAQEENQRPGRPIPPLYGVGYGVVEHALHLETQSPDNGDGQQPNADRNMAVKLDAAIIYAPAGELVPAALKTLDRGGRLVLAGIHMSPTPPLEYRDLYWERVICSVANNTRDDGREFLEEATRVGVETHVQTFDLPEANDALIALKHDAVKGAAVLVV